MAAGCAAPRSTWTAASPLPSFLRRQEPAHATPGDTHSPPAPNRPPHPPSPSPIHPSPLLGGRLGGGWDAPSRHQRPAHAAPLSLRPPLRHSCAGRNHAPAHPPPPPPPRPSRHPCAPSPSFLRRQEPAHATPSDTHPPPAPTGPSHTSIATPARSPPAHPHPNRHTHTRHSCALPPVIPAQAGTTHPHTPPSHPFPLPQFIPPPFQGRG